ncbi:30545_t:CDS:2 [Racocetra persica]|uniref:30545_t:CDS:1 n=1 Tax=Racocetra persica TaxID=160502 RepID=A0ACA9Q8W3_9GLOM|nr:30545_t:CDS:2 [Racocetra persica]
MSKNHKYFKRKPEFWNIMDYLNECDLEPFDLKFKMASKSFLKLWRGRGPARSPFIQGSDPALAPLGRSLSARQADVLCDRIEAKEWEKRRTRQQVHVHQSVNVNLNVTIINGGTVGCINNEAMSSKRNQNEDDREEKLTKRTKINEHFSPVCETKNDHVQRPCDNILPGDIQRPCDENTPPGDTQKSNGHTTSSPCRKSDRYATPSPYIKPDGSTTPSSCSPTLGSSTVEISLFDYISNPFLEENSIISIDDVPQELTFEHDNINNDLFLGEINVSQLFSNYQSRSLELAKTKGLFVESNVHEILSLSSIFLLTQNSHSDIMINMFGSPLLDQIYQEFMPTQQATLDPQCELIFREAIKMAMKNSCEHAVNWLYGKLARENVLRENAGSTILDCLRTLPTLNIRSDHSEMTHITNYLDRIMKGFFDDPNRHIVQWSNTALEESKAKNFDGRTKQPDFTVSVIHQLRAKAVLFVGEVTPPTQKNNVFKICNDLIRIGIFMKDCLDSAIDKGADIKVLGFQCIDYKVDFYAMDLTKGSYVMIHIGQITLPASVKEMLSFVDEFEMLLRIQKIFRESFNSLYANLCHPGSPLAKASFKRKTLSTPKFQQLVSKTQCQ